MAQSPKTKSTLQTIAARLRKVSATKEGHGIIEAVCSGDEIISDVKYVLKTGNDPWDEMTGAFPFGRVVEVFGLEASGKTAMMLLTVHQATEGEIYKRTRVESTDGSTSYTYERLNPDDYEVTCLYIDNEHSLDDSGSIEVNGTKIDIVVSRCETVEGIFKSIDETVNELKKIEEASEKMQMLVVIVDTIAGTATKEELVQEWDKDDYSRRPKQLQEGFRTMIQAISRHNVLVICTNQVGDAIGYEKPKGPKSSTPDWRSFSPPGGRALKFWSTLRVFMWQLNNNYKLLKDDKFQAGILIGFKTVKNRMLAPFREARMVLLFDRTGKGGIRKDLSILESLLFFKLVEEDADRNLIFKLRLNKVAPTTFPELMAALESGATDEEDEEPTTRIQKGQKGKKRKGYKDPRISSRAAFPKFYTEHKADIDALWAVAVKQSKTIGGIDGEEVPEELHDEVSQEDNEGEETPKRASNPFTKLMDQV